MKLELQSALRNNVFSLESLKADLGINTYHHPTLPLVGFKYDQLNSPKTNPIVKECRGIVLEKGSWNLVAKAFNRFFNVGEDLENFANFNWNNFICTSKEDGSLLLLHNYNNEWHVNTSGSFGLGNVQRSSISWKDLFWKISGINKDSLKGLEDHTLVFELCTNHNIVVRRYKTNRVYLLSAFKCSNEEYQELPLDDVVNLRGRFKHCNVMLPYFYQFKSKDEIHDFLISTENSDKTFEGVVLRDSNNLRYKWKTKTYVALHQLKDNGNVLLPKRLVPIVLAGEIDEVVATMPEVKTAIYTVNDKLNKTFNDLKELWDRSKSALTQKDYAMMVKSHPLCSMLFEMRKNHPNGSYNDLHKIWRSNDELLTKKLFDNVEYEFDNIEVEQ